MTKIGLPILQLTKTLAEPPRVDSLDGVLVRQFAGAKDIDTWLKIRARAFAGQQPKVRPWDHADFEAEFLARAWWKAERLWIAEDARADAECTLPVGTVSLALRGAGSEAQPVVHWLMTLPEFRRRGIGRLLMQTLEAQCWQLGHRQIWLETHAGWAEACRLYKRMEYRRPPPLP